MSGEAGAPGTKADGYKIEPPAGRHRAPPTPPRPDRFTVPIAAAAAILTAASLIALAGQAVAPDASAAASTTTAPAARTARTVSVPLEILPATPPSIGAEGAWDPETDGAGLFAGTTTTASAPARAPQTTRGVTRSPGSTVQTPQQALAAITTTPSVTTQSQSSTTRPPTSPTTRTTVTRTATTTSPASTTAAASSSSATPTTEEPTVTPEPTPTDTVPTDIQDVIDQALDDAFGKTP